MGPCSQRVSLECCPGAMVDRGPGHQLRGPGQPRQHAGQECISSLQGSMQAEQPQEHGWMPMPERAQHAQARPVCPAQVGGFRRKECRASGRGLSQADLLGSGARREGGHER